MMMNLLKSVPLAGLPNLSSSRCGLKLNRNWTVVIKCVDWNHLEAAIFPLYYENNGRPVTNIPRRMSKSYDKRISMEPHHPQQTVWLIVDVSENHYPHKRKPLGNNPEIRWAPWSKWSEHSSRTTPFYGGISCIASLRKWATTSAIRYAKYGSPR